MHVTQADLKLANKCSYLCLIRTCQQVPRIRMWTSLGAFILPITVADRSQSFECSSHCVRRHVVTGEAHHQSKLPSTHSW